MVTLIAIGLIGGLITGISPCILPVLPVVFFAGADNGGRSRARPYVIIAGLVVGFSTVALVGALLIRALGLPADTIKFVGLSVLIAVGLGLIFPWVQDRLERLFRWIPKRPPDANGNGFVLGLGLGLLYVPCAGPVLAAITIAGATGQLSSGLVVLTLAFAIGATVPLLVFALAGRAVSQRVQAFQRHANRVRVIAGVAMLALAVGFFFDLPAVLQRTIPNYTDSLQRRVEDAEQFRPQLANLTDGSNSALSNCPSGAAELHDCGPAQPIEATGWLNGDPLEVADLRGEVVLLDFWTYSCINCQRSVPHVQGWHERYRDYGLRVVGVHTPEFSFERDESNVQQGIEKLGITYPVAVDNNYATWTNYRNRYWPAQFLIDANGKVRFVHLGEGGYRRSEQMIRSLLTAANPSVALPAAGDDSGATLTKNRTPETHLNYTKLGRNLVGDAVVPDVRTRYQAPDELPRDAVSFGGDWTIGAESSAAGDDATIRLHYWAKNVYLVAGGDGTVNGVRVSGPPTLYTVVSASSARDETLVLRVSPGVAVYAFTFG